MGEATMCVGEVAMCAGKATMCAGKATICVGRVTVCGGRATMIEVGVTVGLRKMEGCVFRTVPMMIEKPKLTTKN